MSADELDSLSLAELVAKAYPPPDPRIDDMKFGLLRKIAVLGITVAGLAVYGLVQWMIR